MGATYYLASVGHFFGDGLSHKKGVRVGRAFSTSSISSLVHFRSLSLELSARTLPRVSLLYVVFKLCYNLAVELVC